MKLSVSVPNDLWRTVHTEGAGASETVQRALQCLAATDGVQGPLANAPGQANLDRYRDDFESAVERATHEIERMRENGYRFGLSLAIGLNGSDFDALDDPDAGAEIDEIVYWGYTGDLHDSDVFSAGLPAYVVGLIHDKDDDEGDHWPSETFGDEDHTRAGVGWEDSHPILSHTFTESLMAALRDVRDEAVRRLDVPRPHPDQEAFPFEVQEDGEEQ
jgi:hypothetical protein